MFIYLDFKPKYLCFNDVFCSADSFEGCEAEMWGSKSAERLQRESMASGETAFDGWVGLIPPLCSPAVQSWRVGRQRQQRGNFQRSRTRTPPDPPTPEINPPQRLWPAGDNDLQWPRPKPTNRMILDFNFTEIDSFQFQFYFYSNTPAGRRIRHQITQEVKKVDKIPWTPEAHWLVYWF